MELGVGGDDQPPTVPMQEAVTSHQLPGARVIEMKVQQDCGVSAELALTPPATHSWDARARTPGKPLCSGAGTHEESAPHLQSLFWVNRAAARTAGAGQTP